MRPAKRGMTQRCREAPQYVSDMRQTDRRADGRRQCVRDWSMKDIRSHHLLGDECQFLPRDATAEPAEYALVILSALRSRLKLYAGSTRC